MGFYMHSSICIIIIHHHPCPPPFLSRILLPLVPRRCSRLLLWFGLLHNGTLHCDSYTPQRKLYSTVRGWCPLPDSEVTASNSVIALQDKTKIAVLRWSLSLSLLFYSRTPVNATRRPKPLRKLQYAAYRIIHGILVLLTRVVYDRLIICATVYRSHW